MQWNLPVLGHPRYWHWGFRDSICPGNSLGWKILCYRCCVSWHIQHAYVVEIGCLVTLVALPWLPTFKMKGWDVEETGRIYYRGLRMETFNSWTRDVACQRLRCCRSTWNTIPINRSMLCLHVEIVYGWFLFWTTWSFAKYLEDDGLKAALQGGLKCSSWGSSRLIAIGNP